MKVWLRAPHACTDGCSVIACLFSCLGVSCWRNACCAMQVRLVGVSAAASSAPIFFQIRHSGQAYQVNDEGQVSQYRHDPRTCNYKYTPNTNATHTPCESGWSVSLYAIGG